LLLCALVAWPIVAWLVVRRVGCLLGAILSLTLVPMAIVVLMSLLNFAIVLVQGLVRVAGRS
jgi:hypothetical protein